eukprot:2263165-Pleurochrysis_carterae.AAC.1
MYERHACTMSAQFIKNVLESVKTVWSKERDDADTFISRPLVDYGHHIVRQSVLWTFFFLSWGKSNVSSSVLAILHQIAHMPVTRMQRKVYYNFLSKKDQSLRRCSPLLDMDNADQVFRACVNFTQETMERVRTKTKEFLNNSSEVQDDTLFSLKPEEMVVMQYMIETYENGQYASMKIDDLYDVMYEYMPRSFTPCEMPLKDHFDNLQKVGKLFKKCKELLPHGRIMVNSRLQLGTPYGSDLPTYIFDRLKFLHISDECVTLLHLVPRFDDVSRVDIIGSLMVKPLILLQPVTKEEHKVSHNVKGKRLQVRIVSLMDEKIQNFDFTSSLGTTYENLFDWVVDAVEKMMRIRLAHVTDMVEYYDKLGKFKKIQKIGQKKGRRLPDFLWDAFLNSEDVDSFRCRLNTCLVRDMHRLRKALQHQESSSDSE